MLLLLLQAEQPAQQALQALRGAHYHDTHNNASLPFRS